MPAKKTSKSANGRANGHAVAHDILPPPEPRFQGNIGTVYTDSQAEVPELPRAPEGAPNVLLVLLDDTGFGHTSTFGGPVDTPVLQKLADGGLRFNRFHTTALWLSACVRVAAASRRAHRHASTA